MRHFGDRLDEIPDAAAASGAHGCSGCLNVCPESVARCRSVSWAHGDFGAAGAGSGDEAAAALLWGSGCSLCCTRSGSVGNGRRAHEASAIVAPRARMSEPAVRRAASAICTRAALASDSVSTLPYCLRLFSFFRSSDLYSREPNLRPGV
jgi:hypothetical protein